MGGDRQNLRRDGGVSAARDPPVHRAGARHAAGKRVEMPERKHDNLPCEVLLCRAIVGLQAGSRGMVHPLLTKLMCVAAVASVIFAVGPFIFPYVEPMMGKLPFDAAEAVLSASIGFALHTAMFG